MTSDGMDRIVLQGADISVPAKGASRVTLRDIYRHFNAGKNSKAIRRQQPWILPETVLLGRTYLRANYPDAYTALPPPTGFKILIDENMTPRMKAAFPARFTTVDHIGDLGLTGKNDHEVYGSAVNGGYDMLVTHDKEKSRPDDLTMVAANAAQTIVEAEMAAGKERVCLDELPLIVQFDADIEQPNNMEEMFGAFGDEICRHIDPVTMPYVYVSSRRGFIEGKTFARLIEDRWVLTDARDGSQEWEYRTRKKAAAAAIFNKILHTRPKTDEAGRPKPPPDDAERERMRLDATLAAGMVFGRRLVESPCEFHFVQPVKQARDDRAFKPAA